MFKMFGRSKGKLNNKVPILAPRVLILKHCGPKVVLQRLVHGLWALLVPFLAPRAPGHHRHFYTGLCMCLERSTCKLNYKVRSVDPKLLGANGGFTKVC